MDVTLPNGVVIQGVPEGTPKHVIAMKAIKNGLATNKDFGYDEVTDEDVDGSFLEGVGAGMVNVGRRATNLVLPESITPEWASDEAIAEQEELDKYMTFGHGGGGKFVGEMAATMPLGGAASAGARTAAQTLSRGGRVGRALTNTLTRGAGRAGVEGATMGAVLADPGERLQGAAIGGAFGGTAGVLTNALAKPLKTGMVKITQEAKRLQKMTGHFIPLSHSAESGLMKQFYNAFLANFPGVGGKIRGQYKEALEDLRRFAGENAMPDTPKAHNLANLTGKETVEEMIAKMDNYWSTAFDDIKAWSFKIFKDAPIRIDKGLAEALKKHMGPGAKIPRTGDTVTGAQLLELKTALGELAGSMGSRRGAQLRRIQDQITAAMKRNLDPTGKGKGQGAQIFKEYQDAAEYWPIWKSFQDAARRAKDNMSFSPGQLAKTSAKSPQNLIYANKGPGQRAGELGVDVLENFPSRQGLFQTLAATGPVVGGGAAAGGAAGGALAFLATMGIGRAMVSKPLQKFLSGQTRRQQLNRTMRRRYISELQKLGLSRDAAEMVLNMPGRASRQAVAKTGVDYAS